MEEERNLDLGKDEKKLNFMERERHLGQVEREFNQVEGDRDIDLVEWELGMVEGKRQFDPVEGITEAQVIDLIGKSLQGVGVPEC